MQQQLSQLMPILAHLELLLLQHHHRSFLRKGIFADSRLAVYYGGTSSSC